jgi:hypothetical protein
MQQLVDFLQTGCSWAGTVPGEAFLAEEVLARRLVKHVLRHIASRWPTNAVQQGRGLCLSRVNLGDKSYSRSSVALALAVLTSAGLVRRVRSPVGRGTHTEGLARTFINPKLIEFARDWSAQRRALGYKSTKKTAVVLPLPWPTPPPNLADPQHEHQDEWNGAPLEASNDKASSGASVQILDVTASNFWTLLLTHPPKGGLRIPAWPGCGVHPSPPPSGGLCW